MTDFNTDDDEIIIISKSHQKREAEALQVLGMDLLELPLANYNKLDLPSTLDKAISDARRIKSHGALRRQLQLIGKLMRRVEDPEPIRQAVEEWKGGNQKVAREHQRLEQYRDKLLAGDTRLLEQLLAQPDCDGQQLRQLLRQAQQEQEAGSNGKAYRKLFQFLKNLPDTAA